MAKSVYTTMSIRHLIDLGTALGSAINVLDKVGRVVSSRVVCTTVVMCTTMSTLHLTEGSTGRLVQATVNV